MAAEKVAFQQEVVHEGHEQQQRRKAASNEGHKIGHLGQPRRGELLQILLCRLVTGVQPVPNMNISKSGMALLQVLLCRLVTGVQPVPNMNISKSGMALLQVLLCSLMTAVQPVPHDGPSAKEKATPFSVTLTRSLVIC